MSENTLVPYSINDSFNNLQNCTVNLKNENFKPTKEWLNNQNKLAIKDLGARYTPEINIEVDYLIENFDALGKNDKFLNNIEISFNKVFLDFNKKYQKIKNFSKELSILINDFNIIYKDINFAKFTNYKEIEKLLEEIQKNLFENDLADVISNSDNSDVDKFQDTIYDFFNFFREYSERINLSINPYVILEGEAGIGKSHLLADIVNNRIKEEYSSIFLLGQHFREDKNPWNQILDLLDLRCTKDEFLVALNTKAKTDNKRAIIFIDAINEGKGRNFWNKFLISFIETVKQYEWLGLVFSIRNSYFDFIVPNEVIEKNLLIKVTHYGFQSIEDNATKHYFEYYNIEQALIPLLNPEFSNPLFLKIFCEGLNKRGLTIIPDGYEGITNIFDFFIEGIEDKLTDKYSNIKSLKLIYKVIKSLISSIIDNQTIAYDEAYILVENEISPYRLEVGLLDDLISQGLLSKNISYKNRELIESVYFTYERFEDNLKVKFLFDTYLDKDNPKKSFEQEPLKNYLDEKKVHQNMGIIEAMSIQLPELCDIELIDMIHQNQNLIKSFFYSFQWRKVKSITYKTLEHINQLQLKYKGISEIYLEAILQLSSIPNHPLNIKRIHQSLLQLNLNKRDYKWSIFIHNSFIDDGIVKRIINWAWNKQDSFNIDNESLYLYGLTLGWFLTSSNRELRDKTTKALVNLFTNNIDIFLKILKEFENVDDLYVLERLYAVGYGSVLRSDISETFIEFGKYIYNTIFNKNEIVEHILLRDYAKLTVEYINNIFELNIDMVKVLPPYRSKLPSSYPSDEYIDTKYDKYTSAISSILSSMVTENGRSGNFRYGDFGRYTFQSYLSDFDNRDFRIQDINNYAVEIIFTEYILDKKLFETTESNLSAGYSGRMEHKVERIGKKYQWLALHKILAIISDNYKVESRESYRDKKYEDYQGTYQIGCRDIDPTTILKNNEQMNNQLLLNIGSDFENNSLSNLEWMGSKDNLPTINSIVNLYDNEKEYFLLDSYFSLDGNKDNNKYRNLYYSINSFIVKKNELSNIIDYMEEKSFNIGRMPESNSFHDIFLKEYPNSLSYKYIDKYYYSQPQWEDMIDYDQEQLPSKILLTATEYSNEGGSYDLSIDGGIRIKLPNKWLINEMNLKQNLNDGEWINENNELIFFNSTQKDTLFSDKNLLQQFLDDNGYSIFWALTGEKQMRNTVSNHNRDDDFIGITDIMGYAYFDNGEFKENIDLKFEESKNE